jgi:hypothetical protein
MPDNLPIGTPKPITRPKHIGELIAFEWLGKRPPIPIVPPTITISYLIEDDFITNRSVGQVNHTLAEPGPGTRHAEEWDGQFTISSEKLNFPIQTTPTWGDLEIDYNTIYARIPGRIFYHTFNQLTGWPKMWRSGWATNRYDLYNQHGFNVDGIDFEVVVDGNNFLTDDHVVISTTYHCGYILRSKGCFYVVKGGVYTTPTLIWVDDRITWTPLLPNFSNYSASGTIERYVVGDLAGVWASDYGIATSYYPTPNNPQAGIMVTDAIIEFTWTPSAGEILEIDFRKKDSENRWILRCTQTTGDFQLIKREASIEDHLFDLIQAWVVGTSYRIIIVTKGNNIEVYHSTTTTSPVGQDDNFNDPFNNTETVINVAGFSHGTNFISWPIIVPDPFL